MSDEQGFQVVDAQQAIVRRYAVQLREAACAGVDDAARPAKPGVRRCYELLNECAMELADLDRARGALRAN